MQLQTQMMYGFILQSRALLQRGRASHRDRAALVRLNSPSWLLKQSKPEHRHEKNCQMFHPSTQKTPKKANTKCAISCFFLPSFFVLLFKCNSMQLNSVCVCGCVGGWGEVIHFTVVCLCHLLGHQNENMLAYLQAGIYLFAYFITSCN